MSSRKTLVLDTSVLLYDMSAIHSFPGNDIVIPLPVLDELDRFKDKPGLLGESARYVNRYLDKLRETGRLDQAVKLPDTDQTIRVEIKFDHNTNVPDGLNPGYADNQILATALYLSREYPDKKIKIITKDINLRVKCDALGLKAEDYYRDYINLGNAGAYTGEIKLKLPDKKIDKFFNTGTITVDEISLDNDVELLPNQFIVATGLSNGSMLGVHRNGTIHKIQNSELDHHIGIEPRNKEQKFALSLLNDPGITLVTLTGIAGSGKTFLTLMAAMANLNIGTYKRIIFTRSIQPVGRDLGYLPGDMSEKMSPWLAPIADNFRHAFGDTSYFECMISKGQIDIAPLSYIRGRTFNDSFVIVDEAQNATIHELKTIITRVGKGSKIVLLGDTDQVDTPYIDSKSNGLTIVVEKFKASYLAGHIRFNRGQRSEIASLASNLL
ncbi:phosphate starvation-inducible protein PhoH [archaeon]|nr:phosphate starvation-inducible protein PhoH [archaeon]